MKLPLLIVLLLLSLAGRTQKNKTVEVDMEVYRKNVSDNVALRAQVAQLEPLKDDTARLRNDIRYYISALQTSTKKWEDLRVEYNRLDSANQVRKEIISGQDNVIKDKNAKIAKLEKRGVPIFRQIINFLAGVAVGAAVGKLL